MEPNLTQLSSAEQQKQELIITNGSPAEAVMFAERHGALANIPALQEVVENWGELGDLVRFATIVPGAGVTSLASEIVKWHEFYGLEFNFDDLSERFPKVFTNELCAE